jgi:hypothetical protein
MLLSGHVGWGCSRPGAGRPKLSRSDDGGGNTYSLSRAIAETLSHGVPQTGLEAELHREEATARAGNSELGALSAFQAPGSGVIHLPLRRDIGVGAGGGASIVGVRMLVASDLLSWSACIQAGAVVLENLRENHILAQVTALPSTPDWVPEVGMSPAADPAFGQVALGPPRRVSGMITVSRQLLIQGAGTSGSGSLDAMLIADLSRELNSQLDYCCLYGSPDIFPNQPRGVLHTVGIHRIDIGNNTPCWGELVDAQRRVENERISIASFAHITSPDVKAALLQMPMWAAGSDRSVWEAIANPISSTVVDSEQIFLWRLQLYDDWHLGKCRLGRQSFLEGP